MKCICAWCHKELDDTKSGPPDAVTHSICADCVNNIEFQQGVILQRYLDALEHPVVLVDNDVRAEWANTAARRSLGKEQAAIIGKLGGEVFECAYARLPEGCGHTIHCSGCVIRRSVTHTYATGESCIRVPATLHCDGKLEVSLNITTHKSNDAVLLQIDEIVSEP